MLRQDGASFEEWKREEELARLVKEHSARYQRHPSLGYRSAPGEVAAEALGLLYRVRSSRELSAVFVQNLMFLEDYWVTPLVVDSFHRHLLQERVAAQPGVRLAEILEAKGEITADMVYALIASEALYVDLTAFPLGEHQEVRLFTDAASAAVLPHISLPSTPSLLHTSLTFGGRIYVLIELNPDHVLLTSANLASRSASRVPSSTVSSNKGPYARRLLLMLNPPTYKRARSSIRPAQKQ